MREWYKLPGSRYEEQLIVALELLDEVLEYVARRNQNSDGSVEEKLLKIMAKMSQILDR